jgi:hypothetical protein
LFFGLLAIETLQNHFFFSFFKILNLTSWKKKTKKKPKKNRPVKNKAAPWPHKNEYQCKPALGGG